MKITIRQTINRMEEDETVLMPFTHIQKAPSRYHKKLYYAFNHWLNVPEKKLAVIMDILQTLHSASLLIDDIQDNSTLRYGMPVAHSVYGIGLTINAASQMMAVTMKKVLTLEYPQAVYAYLDTLVELHRGQGIDIYWRDNLLCPTEEEYSDMIIQKTSSMFIMAVRLMEPYSNVKGDFVKLASLLGLYYQIRDDYCNLNNQKALDIQAGNKKSNGSAELKSYCEDLKEGKFSLPIIHCQKFPEIGKQVLHILQQRTNDYDLKKRCVTLLEQAGSLQYTKHVLHNLEAEIHSELALYPSNPGMLEIMEELANWKSDN